MIQNHASLRITGRQGDTLTMKSSFINANIPYKRETPTSVSAVSQDNQPYAKEPYSTPLQYLFPWVFSCKVTSGRLSLNWRLHLLSRQFTTPRLFSSPSHRTRDGNRAAGSHPGPLYYLFCFFMTTLLQISPFQITLIWVWHLLLRLIELSIKQRWKNWKTKPSFLLHLEKGS